MNMYKLRPVIAIFTGLCFFYAPINFAAGSDRHKQHANKEDVVPAPGYSELDYSIPGPGTYQLPPLGIAGDGNVIDSKGNALHLDSLYGDKIALLSFIYSSCSDVNGCPLATFVMSRVQNRVIKDPELEDQVKIISLSFDPKQDTPQVMDSYGSGFRSADFEWHFLTTMGSNELQPILEAYNQFIQRELDENGKESGNISHLLRVFLIDRERRIRNIYSTSFLHTDILVNDLRTLLREQGVEEKTESNMSVALNNSTLYGAGDNKHGYDNKNYKTQTLSLNRRTGEPANLERYIKKSPLGLPAITSPNTNPITSAKIDLGRQLFYDRRLSHNNTISCAMCHIPEQGFTSNEMATAVGIEGKTVRRNSPALYNVAYLDHYFHDGRETTLEQQIWGPLLAINEMGNPSVGLVINKIKSLPEYQQKFEQAFKGKPASMETVGMAIASYERVLVSGNSQFDQWYFNKDKTALSRSAMRGYKIFSEKGNCISCHSIGDRTALFTDNQLHNTGVGYGRTMNPEQGAKWVLVAPGQYLQIDQSVIADAAEPKPNDLGLYEITGDPDDRWKYKTPSLRNVALTPPYMHDGSLSSLQEVIQFYNRGGIVNEVLDPKIKPLYLSNRDVDDLVSFLHALTGDNIDEIIADAFATHVGNTKEN